VSTPTNASADVITSHLIASKLYEIGKLVRLNGFMRSELDIPERILPFCSDGENLSNVVRSRIIISTCATAGQFFQLNLSAGHFTHVFVDEAGCCTEPDTLIPAVLLAIEKGGHVSWKK